MNPCYTGLVEISNLQLVYFSGVYLEIGKSIKIIVVVYNRWVLQGSVLFALLGRTLRQIINSIYLSHHRLYLLDKKKNRMSVR